MSVIAKIVLAAVALGSLSLAQEPAQHSAKAKTENCCELRMAMRQLWEEHIAYTRNFIISSLAGLPDGEAVAQRLLKNQDDIGAAIAPYYGDEAGKKLASLLRDHIMVAGEVVKAALSDKKDELAAQQKKWAANGKEIAAFLSKANPNWSKKSLEEMLQKHLELTTGEVVGRLKKDWAADIKAYDEGHEHMLMFADMLAEGIKLQFPAKFKG